MSSSASEAVVVEVLAFEDLPFGAPASRRAVARWSDGSVSEAVRWLAGETSFCEGDLIGKTREAIEALYVRRHRDTLRS